MNPKIVEQKIKALSIQGAENIAKEAVKSLSFTARHANAKHAKELINKLRKTKNELVRTRQTEPCMFNAVSFALGGLQGKTLESVRKTVFFNAGRALSHFEHSDKKIACLGAGLVKNNSIIFTHCHSSSVVNVLKEAKRQRKKFEVYSTETRPMLQGRRTAKELSAAGIRITHFVDSAARAAIKKADAVFLGCDAISAKGYIINKVGSGMFAEIAKNHGVPVFVFSDSWKFDRRSIHSRIMVEERSPREVWRNPPKGIKVENPAFERIDFCLIKKIVSEKGVLAPKQLLKKLL